MIDLESLYRYIKQNKEEIEDLKKQIKDLIEHVVELQGYIIADYRED